jgi:hypothetical protein
MPSTFRTAAWREKGRSPRVVVTIAPATSDPVAGEDYTLRWIYLHMIEEYARHNGHADFLRERIDGATGE